MQATTLAIPMMTTLTSTREPDRRTLCRPTSRDLKRTDGFSNRITGRDWNILCQPGRQPARTPTDIRIRSRLIQPGYNIIGNVLGTAGYHAGYEAYPPNSYTRAQCNLTIYEIGFGGGVCDGDGRWGGS